MRYTGAAPQTLKGYTRNVLAVAFSPDGKTVASASLDVAMGRRDGRHSADAGRPYAWSRL
jgi:hypothetical protein